MMAGYVAAVRIKNVRRTSYHCGRPNPLQAYATWPGILAETLELSHVAQLSWLES
jgi:hypothetical protein